MINILCPGKSYSKLHGAESRFNNILDLRAIFWEYRESKDTHKKSNFFLFCQNIPLGKLIQEKIIQSSNELFNGRKFKKFEKCIKWRF